MAEFRYLARLGVRQDLAIRLSDGREIPAVMDLGTGRLFLWDGNGHRHVVAWRDHQDQEWLVLDGAEGRRFADLEEVLKHLEALGGEPIPSGQVAVVGQIGGQLVYASAPEGAGR